MDKKFCCILAVVTVILNSDFSFSCDSDSFQYSKGVYRLRPPSSKEEWDTYHKIRVAEIHNKYCPELVYAFDDPEEKQSTNFSFIFLDTSLTEKNVVGYQHYGARTFAAENGDLRLGYIWTYECMGQRIYIDIIYSRDSILWKRFEDEPSFNPNGEFGSWNGGMIFSDVPYIVKDGYAYELLKATSRAHFYGGLDVTGEYLERRY